MNHVFKLVLGGLVWARNSPMANLLDLFGVCVDCHPVYYLSATLIRNILLLVGVNQACENTLGKCTLTGLHVFQQTTEFLLEFFLF